MDRKEKKENRKNAVDRNQKQDDARIKTRKRKKPVKFFIIKKIETINTYHHRSKCVYVLLSILIRFFFYISFSFYRKTINISGTKTKQHEEQKHAWILNCFPSLQGSYCISLESCLNFCQLYVHILFVYKYILLILKHIYFILLNVIILLFFLILVF